MPKPPVNPLTLQERVCLSEETEKFLADQLIFLDNKVKEYDDKIPLLKKDVSELEKIHEQKKELTARAQFELTVCNNLKKELETENKRKSRGK